MTVEEINKLFVICTFVHNRATTPKWGFHFTRLPMNNLVLVYDGTGMFESRGERCVVGKGDLVLFRKGEAQHMVTNRENPLKLYTVNFECAILELTSSGLSAEQPLLSLPFVTHIHNQWNFNRLLQLFEKLHRLHISAQGIHQAEERLVLARILELLSYGNTPSQTLNYRVINCINQTLAYMAKNFSRSLTLSELSTLSGLSQSHFSATFKKATGTSPIDYLMRLRIAHAKQLLRDGESVAQVAEETGFSDIYYFSKVFKKLEGQPPSHYAHSVQAYPVPDFSVSG